MKRFIILIGSATLAMWFTANPNWQRNCPPPVQWPTSVPHDAEVVTKTKAAEVGAKVKGNFCFYTRGA